MNAWSFCEMMGFYTFHDNNVCRIYNYESNGQFDGFICAKDDPNMQDHAASLILSRLGKSLANNFYRDE